MFLGIINKTHCILPFLSLCTVEDRGLPVCKQLIWIADFQKQTFLICQVVSSCYSKCAFYHNHKISQLKDPWGPNNRLYDKLITHHVCYSVSIVHFEVSVKYNVEDIWRKNGQSERKTLIQTEKEVDSKGRRDHHQCVITITANLNNGHYSRLR